jgi:hypothetical protein
MSFWGSVEGPTTRESSVSVPPRVSNGMEIEPSMEDIGLRDVELHRTVLIDRLSEDEEW